MLGNYEQRRFEANEKVWIGHYRDLTNVLHWHFECEMIIVKSGGAMIRIGEYYYEAVAGEVFFCPSEELHYIISLPDSLVDIMIFDKNIAKKTAGKYNLLSPKIVNCVDINNYFIKMQDLLLQKGILYCEALEVCAEGLFLDIFRSNPIVKKEEKNQFYKNLIDKINEEFAFITFNDVVAFSGYSASHFSKMFKKLCGMTFSEYLNIIKIENAVIMIKSNDKISMTSVSSKCGFSTVRNFNRVFKEITGYSPHLLPKNFVIDAGLRVSSKKGFDPTNQNSVLY